MKTNGQVTAGINKKSQFAHNGDCISSLHDSIIGRILSQLPTKDAVQTSSLSKAWRYKWATLYKVDVEDKSFIPFWSNAPFVNFMDRILLYLPHIISFRLTCHGHDLHCMLRWIAAATKGNNFESLEVNNGTRGIIFSSTLLNNTSLRNLKLNLPCILDVFATMNFVPNLTHLYLRGVQIQNGNVKVSFNFPVLQTLNVLNCKWSNVKCVEVYAPSLTYLKYKTLGDEQSGRSLVIHGTKISNFEIYGEVPQNIIIQSSVVSASLMNQAAPDDLKRKIGLRVCKLFNSLSNLEELELSDFMAQALQFGLPLARHAKLRRFSIYDFYNIGHILQLLRAMPSLNYWYIDVSCLDDYDYDYNAMESMPSCVVSHLEEVELYDFCGGASSYNLAKLLLENGKALKKVSVILVNFPQIHNEVTERLCALPTCSTRLTILVKKNE